jgi:hypothetical protein
MDTFLDAFSQPKLNQEDTNHFSGYIISNEIEAVIMRLLTKKSPGPEGFTAEFCQTFEEELILILLKYF